MTAGKPRDRWSSQIAFYFAAIGAAVGFGNVWRFPSLAADFGGGAFFIPYLLALFLIGLPLFLLETALGQYYQTGDVGVFGSFHARIRGVGLASVACSFMVVTYYSVLIAWVIHAFFDSFGSDDPWAREGITGAEAKGYFYNNVIGMETLTNANLYPTRIVWANVGFSTLTWVLIYLCLAGGAKWTGRITYFTMGLPIVLMFLFLGRGVSLEGSSDGIREYIGIWDLSVLADRPEVWSEAVSQIFFSLGITFGILTAYGSYNDRNDNALFHSCVISFSNCLFSFISGFGVFAALGHLAHISNQDVGDLEHKSFSLVFGTWPVVFGTLPGGEHWVRLLFFDLFLLGIDSGFGLLEGSLTAAADTVYLSRYPKYVLAAVLCIVGYCCSLIYCTDAGLIFLDVVDWYINFVMLFVGFLESFAAAWIYGLEKQVAKLGAPAVFLYMGANFVSVLAASIVWFAINEDWSMWVGFVVLIVIYGGGVGAALFSLQGREGSFMENVYELTFGNIMELTNNLSSTVGYIPSVWAILMKQFIPQAILVLFINLSCADRKGAEGEKLAETIFSNYEGYVQWPFQIMGYGTVVLAAFLFLFGVFFPEAYSGLTLIDAEELVKQLEAEPEVKKEEKAEPAVAVEELSEEAEA